MDENMFTVGKIVNTHGIKGEVKVFRITDFEERFAIGETVYATKDGDTMIPFVIDGHRRHKGHDLLHFEGADLIDDVEHLKNSTLKISERQLTELDEDEYYYHEIIGCDVYTTDNEHLGPIKEILSPGANDVWVVNRSGGGDLLIPYISDVVKEVDITAQKVIIEPMEGLLD